uniref:Uncharacterized protein LOC111101994 n=1 Tax=Crassostrea virginica TaxID=6565 RepID=A0A8B8AFU1_CRAVI|nr:uncharacterized protein LOC111101994 [Crassostrea virginica]
MGWGYTLFIITIIGDLVNFTVPATDDNSLCYNKWTNITKCCQDYKNVSGTCEACIGSWGKECTKNCTYGYYGHGCRRICKCNRREKCDSKHGCVEIGLPENHSHVDILNMYNTLTTTHGINVCYNSTTETAECCEGFTNRSGICEKDGGNTTSCPNCEFNFSLTEEMCEDKFRRGIHVTSAF